MAEAKFDSQFEIIPLDDYYSEDTMEDVHRVMHEGAMEAFPHRQISFKAYNSFASIYFDNDTMRKHSLVIVDKDNMEIVAGAVGLLSYHYADFKPCLVIGGLYVKKRAVRLEILKRLLKGIREHAKKLDITPQDVIFSSPVEGSLVQPIMREALGLQEQEIVLAFKE